MKILVGLGFFLENYERTDPNRTIFVSQICNNRHAKYTCNVRRHKLNFETHKKNPSIGLWEGSVC